MYNRAQGSAYSVVRTHMTTHKINQPTDRLLGAPLLEGETLFDFWRWAFSDLCDDDIKGFFAEWLVHKLLGVESTRRVSWANSDVVTSSQVTIEVKATSYWQSWKVIDQHGRAHVEPIYKLPADDSRIRFGGLLARDSTSTVDMTTLPALKSQMYVFAFQHEKDIARWNAMDLAQWEFYALRAEEVAQLGGRSVSIKKLRTKCAPLSAIEFVAHATKLIEQIVRARSAV